MQMRTGDASGLAYRSDPLALMNFLSHRHPDLRKVEVGGEQSRAVVNQHRVSRREAAACEDNLAIIGGEDRGSGSAIEVHSVVLTLFRSVEEPQVPIVGGHRTLSRPAEIPSEHRRLRRLVISALEGCLVLGKPTSLLGGRIDVAVGHAQLAPIKLGSTTVIVPAISSSEAPPEAAMMRTSRSPATCSSSSGAKAQKPPWVGKNASSRVPSFPVGGELAPRTWIKITSPGRALPGWISNSGSDLAACPPSSAAANARAPSIRGYLLEDCTAASAHHKQFTPMKVLVADDLSPESIEILRREKNLSVDVRIGLKPPELKAEIFQYHALAVRSATKVTAEIIEAGKNLKVIGRAGVGVDNVDLEAANRRGVVVMNTPGGNTITVAEHAIAMMLALARHIPQATASMKAGQWEKKRFQGRELFKKTLGVIGVGNIGSVVVERCIGMKMKVIAYDPFISPEAARRMG